MGLRKPSYGHCACGAVTSHRADSGWICTGCAVRRTHGAASGEVVMRAKDEYEETVRRDVAADPVFGEKLLRELREAGDHTAGFRVRIFGRE